jgi:hypothetical protein
MLLSSGPAGPKVLTVHSTFPVLGPHTQSAGTSSIAQHSGGDSMAIDDASAFEETLARIRERYALYFYLPEGRSLATSTPAGRVVRCGAPAPPRRRSSLQTLLSGAQRVR